MPGRGEGKKRGLVKGRVVEGRKMGEVSARVPERPQQV